MNWSPSYFAALKGLRKAYMQKYVEKAAKIAYRTNTQVGALARYLPMELLGV